MNEQLIQVNCGRCNKVMHVTEKIFKDRRARKRPHLCEDCKTLIRKEGAVKAAETFKQKSPEEMAAINASKNSVSRMTPEQLEAYKKKMSESIKKRNANWSEEKWAEYRASLKAGQINMSEESKRIRSEKISQTNKKYWENLSDEEREARRQKTIDALANMSDEAKAKKSANSAAAASRVWANMDDEDRYRIIQKRSDSMTNYWAALTDEERERAGKLISEGIKNMSREDAERRALNSSIATRKYFEQISNEEMMERSKRLKAANIKRYENMTEEEKQLINDKRSVAMLKYWANITPEKFDEWNINLSKNRNIGGARYKGGLNSNEGAFMYIMSINGILCKAKYSSEIVHPDFKKMFPNNPVNGAKHVTPVHVWDFMIQLKDRNILVDVDGSIHFNKSFNMPRFDDDTKTYQMLDYIKFKETQRPYQTDGMDAYIVECPHDKIKESLKVRNVKTGEYKTLSEFITYVTINRRPW